MAINPNFPNFNNNIGRRNPIQPKTTGQGPQQSPSVQQNPSESVQIGAQPVADAKVDSVATGEQKTDAAPALQSAPTTSSIPSQIGGALIAGVNSTSSTSKASFPGLSLNGLGATSFQTLSGRTVATVNPLKPKTAVKMPTTSITSFGLGDTSFTTTSGRVITA